MDIVLTRSTVTEFGVYKEAGAIVIGWKFKEGERIAWLIVQIEEEGLDLPDDQLGVHVEIDGDSFYGGVRDFQYDESGKRIRLALHPGKCDGIDELQVEIPGPRSSADEQLLQEFARSYRNSLSSTS